MKGRALIMALLPIILTEARQSFPVTLIVGDGDYASIQDAINASFDGDEIIVEPGIYYENIDYLGKDIILRSIDPLDFGDTVLISGVLLDITRINCLAWDRLLSVFLTWVQASVYLPKA